MAPSVHPPQQERSRRTLRRILSATERLLLKRPFEDIGVQEIVRAARTSVGSFYARFDDKAALLTALYERYDDDEGIQLPTKLTMSTSSLNARLAIGRWDLARPGAG